MSEGMEYNQITSDIYTSKVIFISINYIRINMFFLPICFQWVQKIYWPSPFFNSIDFPRPNGSLINKLPERIWKIDPLQVGFIGFYDSLMRFRSFQYFPICLQEPSFWAQHPTADTVFIWDLSSCGILTDGVCRLRTSILHCWIEEVFMRILKKVMRFRSFGVFVEIFIGYLSANKRVFDLMQGLSSFCLGYKTSR